MKMTETAAKLVLQWRKEKVTMETIGEYCAVMGMTETHGARMKVRTFEEFGRAQVRRAKRLLKKLACCPPMLVLCGAMLLTACGKDGEPGPQGPAGEDGETYLSTTNPLTGEITTIAVTGFTQGDNSPVILTVNLNTGDGGNAGDSRPVAVMPATVEPEVEPEQQQEEE